MMIAGILGSLYLSLRVSLIFLPVILLGIDRFERKLSVEDYLKKAKHAEIRGNYKKAIKFYEMAFKISPSLEEIENALRLAKEKYKVSSIIESVEKYHKKGDITFAENELNRLFSVTFSTDWRSTVGSCQIFLKELGHARLCFSKRNLSLAIDSTLKSLKIYPLDKEAIDLYIAIKKKQFLAYKMFEEGLDLYKKKQYLRAFKKFDQCLEIDSSYQESRKYVMKIQKKLKSFIDGKKFSTAKEWYYAEGFFHYQLSNYQEAINCWKKALALSQKVEMFEITKKEIEEYISRAEEKIKTKEVEKYLSQGEEEFEKGNYQQAKLFFEKVLALKPSHPIASQYLKTIEQKTLEEERLLAEKARKEKIKKYLKSGISFYNRGEYKQARIYFQKVVKLSPDHPRANKYLGLIKQKLKKPKKEVKVKIKKKIKGDPEKHYQQGLIYYASGLLERAIKEWEIALTIDPEHQKAKMALKKAKSELEKK